MKCSFTCQGLEGLGFEFAEEGRVVRGRSRAADGAVRLGFHESLIGRSSVVDGLQGLRVQGHHVSNPWSGCRNT